MRSLSIKLTGTNWLLCSVRAQTAFVHHRYSGSRIFQFRTFCTGRGLLLCSALNFVFCGQGEKSAIRQLQHASDLSTAHRLRLVR